MKHIPVLSREAIESLNLKSGDNCIDCTLGDGGHAELILEKTKPAGKLLGIDADPEAILRAKQFLYPFGERVIFERNNFVHLKEMVAGNNFFAVNAILIDLGWSSPQFEERGRGFSFQKENEPLDMRFDKMGSKKSAADIVNGYAKDELEKVFRNFGEEKFSREIAEKIVVLRKEKKLEKVGELTEVILSVYREKLKSNKEIPWIGGAHPATKIFQALRIEVNEELQVIKQVLPQAVEILVKEGRLAVITFHSLEDRIVKQFFQKISGKEIKIINKKPIIAGDEELKFNPRARSAKLRVIEKI